MRHEPVITVAAQGVVRSHAWNLSRTSGKEAQKTRHHALLWTLILTLPTACGGQTEPPPSEGPSDPGYLEELRGQQKVVYHTSNTDYLVPLSIVDVIATKDEAEQFLS